MSRAIELLYNEHLVIKSVVSFREHLKQLSGSDPGKFRTEIKPLIDFFRSYADKFHHYKEEKILFPMMCERNEMLKDSIIEEMLDNHRDFRIMVGKIETASEEDNSAAAVKELFAYSEMLLNHIAAEDDELFQIAETLFTESELDKMFFDFEDIDRELGNNIKSEYESFASRLIKHNTI